MTAELKSAPQLFYVFMMFCLIVQRKSRSQSDATVDPADLRGLATT
jgi:hypothetical protein